MILLMMYMSINTNRNNKTNRILPLFWPALAELANIKNPNIVKIILKFRDILVRDKPIILTNFENSLCYLESIISKYNALN